MISQARLFEPPVQVMDGPPVLTARVGLNAPLFADIMRLYVPEGSTVLDMTYGLGGFWNTQGIKERYRLVTMDMELPAMVHGVLEHLPFQPATFDCVVVDPPYANHGSTTTMLQGIASTYNLKPGNTTAHILGMYHAALAEAAICLKKGGVAVVKCQDGIEFSRQYWIHVAVLQMAEMCGFSAEDLFVLVQENKPAMRHPFQRHARKNHSFFWVFQRPTQLALMEATV